MNSLILSACKDNLQKDLLESCKAGDLKAQLQIYNKLYKVLFNISLNIVEDTAIAENIMQETFWIAFERIHAFSGRASFVNWIINMVQDSSIECWRKKNVPVPGARMDS
ncbi:MAG TPA: sigma factor [Bacteroidales bacterium]|nr:sigma factor [Bacteroidales bacterium]